MHIKCYDYNILDIVVVFLIKCIRLHIPDFIMEMEVKYFFYKKCKRIHKQLLNRQLRNKLRWKSSIILSGRSLKYY